MKNIKTLKSAVIFLVIALFALGPANQGRFGMRLDTASLAAASEIYYDIKIKLIWDKPFNLDLFVAEPDGEVASPYNLLTVNGGEIGYYDSAGEWHSGGSGDNKAPEVYRIRHAPEGRYKIEVYCPGLSVPGLTAEALVYVTLYEESSITETFKFPAEGTQTVDLSEEGWWRAGSFWFEIPKSRGCFIATAAYGTALDSEVFHLRGLRDRHLTKSLPWSMLVNLYYRLSPPYAGLIARRPFLKQVVRVHLAPFVLLARLSAYGGG